MTIEVGIGLAFIAMLCWGIGDFFIQKSTRKIGDWETMLVITLFGTIILLPFVYIKLPTLFEFTGELIVLSAAALVLLVSSVMEFEGFKKGKLSVLEPLLALEIIAATSFAGILLGDHITWIQTIVIVVLVISLILVSLRERHLSKNFFLEKGVVIFIGGAVLMGLADFLLGWGSRITDPLFANFIVNVIMAVISLLMLISQRKLGRLVKDVAANPGTLLIMSITDNVAWIAFAFAMTLVPIAIATGLSETSIVIAVLLGLFINKEGLQRHQKIGLVGAIVSALILAVLTA